MTPRWLFASVVAVVVHAAPAAGQAAPPDHGSDSTAWQRVLVHVVERLSVDLLHASTDSSPQPWRIELPDAEPQRALIDTQLRRILRARAPTDTDSVTHMLTLGPLRIEGDTARVEMRHVVTRRCPGSTQTTGYGNREIVLVPRWPHGWGGARSTSVTHGDRVGCAR